MFNHRFTGGISLPRIVGSPVLVFWLVVVNLAFNVLANASFRISAMNAGWRGIIAWQVAGNLAGLITVITLTWLLRYMPLSVAFPLTTGLSVLGIQMIAASWIFREPISEHQWLGTLAIILGIWVILR